MRFMLIMLPDPRTAYQGTGLPDVEAVAAMTKYNQALAEAGVLLSLDGLHPPAAGARVAYAGGRPTVTDGPFPEAREIIGGYWMIRVKSREEAIEWARRVPAAPGDVVELRRVFEMSEFPPEVQDAARL